MYKLCPCVYNLIHFVYLTHFNEVFVLKYLRVLALKCDPTDKSNALYCFCFLFNKQISGIIYASQKSQLLLFLSSQLPLIHQWHQHRLGEVWFYVLRGNRVQYNALCAVQAD